MRKASRSLMRHYEAAVASTGVTISQFALLRALERHGDLPLSRLADDMVMERTSLYRTLRPLVDAGAVTLVPAARGRAKVACLQEPGRALIARVLPHWEGVQRAVVSALGADVWQQLASTLQHIPPLLDRADDAARSTGRSDS
ncbi:MAG: MarR family winged helix-turn-helix transcriptional regulator [Acidobacteriota bacterium]